MSQLKTPHLYVYSIVLHKQPCFHGCFLLVPQRSKGQTGEETGNKIATQSGFM